MAADRISLSIPHAPTFVGIARLVIGGLAARLDLSYETLEDLQLALASVLERDGYMAEPTVIVRVEVEPDSVGIVVGPVDPAALHGDLERESPDGVSMRRLLETLVNEVLVEEEPGGHALRLVKHVPREAAVAEEA